MEFLIDHIYHNINKQTKMHGGVFLFFFKVILKSSLDIIILCSTNKINNSIWELWWF